MPLLKPMSTVSRERTLRGSVFLAGLLVVVCALRVTRNDVLSETGYPAQALHMQRSSDAELRPTIASKERMLETTTMNTDFVYLPSPNILFMTLAKGGTTSTWNWLYRGLTGREKFNMTECKTYVQDVRSHCWGDEAVHLHLLPTDEQWRILTSHETLRVAIQRNPFERIVSSFKSKFTCEDSLYGTDLRNRATMVPQLRRQAGLPEGQGCMSITEFAEALEGARQKAGTPGHKLTSLRNMDVHVRPQEFYFDEIDYDTVLDVRELSNVEYLQPIIDRLKYKDLVKGGIEHRHASKGSQLMIPEDAARLLYSFALESKPGKSRYISAQQ